MREELEKQLVAKHPAIFAEYGMSPHQSCMAFGLEVGDGWYSLIDTLCEALTYTYTTSIHIDTEDAQRLGITKSYSVPGANEPKYFLPISAPQVVATQVKDKFGELRFYYRLVHDANNVELAESGKYPELEQVNLAYSNYLDGVVHFAKIASLRTCSVTGAPGALYVRNGWLKVLSHDVVQTQGYAGYVPYIPIIKDETFAQNL